MTIQVAEGGYIGAKPVWTYNNRTGIWRADEQYRLSRSYLWPATVGNEMAGGYFAGYITYGSETWLPGSAGKTYILIVAPKASGESPTTLAYKTGATCDGSTSNATSTSQWDGYHNTYSSALGSSSAHPAAAYCRGLSIGGYNDWYLGSFREMARVINNLYTLPGWIISSGTSEAFSNGQTTIFGTPYNGLANYWTSTGNNCDAGGGAAEAVSANTGGGSGSYPKTDIMYVRAIRRILYPS